MGPVKIHLAFRGRTSSLSLNQDVFFFGGEVVLRRGWKQLITIPTILAGAVGGAFGLASKRRRPLAASYAVNLAIVSGCYYGTRELARDAQASEPDDHVNSVIGGIASGALLGRLQDGQLGAIRYAIIFATVGTTVDFATLQLQPSSIALHNK